MLTYIRSNISRNRHHPLCRLASRQSWLKQLPVRAPYSFFFITQWEQREAKIAADGTMGQLPEGALRRGASFSQPHHGPVTRFFAGELELSKRPERNGRAL